MEGLELVGGAAPDKELFEELHNIIMLELLPSSTVRDTASYDRIDKLLKSVRSIVRTFESYLRSTQNAYVSFTDECKEYCERF